MSDFERELREIRRQRVEEIRQRELEAANEQARINLLVEEIKTRVFQELDPKIVPQIESLAKATWANNWEFKRGGKSWHVAHEDEDKSGTWWYSSRLLFTSWSLDKDKYDWHPQGRTRYELSKGDLRYGHVYLVPRLIIEFRSVDSSKEYRDLWIGQNLRRDFDKITPPSWASPLGRPGTGYYKGIYKNSFNSLLEIIDYTSEDTLKDAFRIAARFGPYFVRKPPKDSYMGDIYAPR